MPTKFPDRMGLLTMKLTDFLRHTATAACILATIGQSHAAEPCSLTYDRATAIGHAATRADPTNIFTDYNGDQAAKLLAAINAQPPVTAFPAERVLVIERPDDDLVMVALVHDGCAGERLSTTPEAWVALRRGAIGDAL